MLKKRQSRRISSRKKHNIEKKVKARAKKQAKLKKKESLNKTKLPKNVLLTEEELEHLKNIKDEERRRANLGQPQGDSNWDFKFKKLVEENDLIVEVLDPRDPVGSRNPLLEEYLRNEQKDLVLFINHRDCLPLENTVQWVSYFRDRGYNSTYRMEDLIINKKMGIFGQKGTGKMYLFKSLEKNNNLDKNLFRSDCTQFDLLALLRNVIPLKSIFYKKVLGDFLLSINRDDFCLYFGVPHFESFTDLEKMFIKKFNLTTPRKVVEIILEEFHKERILFWRGIDSKINLIYT